MSDKFVILNNLREEANKDGHQMQNVTEGVTKSWCTCAKCKQTIWLYDRDAEGKSGISDNQPDLRIIGIPSKCKDD